MYIEHIYIRYLSGTYLMYGWYLIRLLDLMNNFLLIKTQTIMVLAYHSQ